MPRAEKEKKRAHPYTLEKQIEQATALKPQRHRKADRKMKKAAAAESGGGGGDEQLTESLAKKVTELAREQRLAEEEEAEAALLEENGEEDEEEDPMTGDDDDDEDEATYTGEVQISEEDEKALAMFMHGQSDAAQQKQQQQPSSNPTKTLGEIIAEKLREAETRGAAAKAHKQQAQAEKQRSTEAELRVRQLYQQVGVVLRTYTTGKLPKAFKVLPTLRNWEELLFHAQPDLWSPHAMRAAVRLFSGGANAKMAQRFFSLVLLPCVRDAIREKKKLHFALYMALKKALYQPTAFFKGFLLPLCEAGDCTLREAVIVSSVLAKCTIPMLHAAACIIRIARMRYSGAASVFLRTLLDKKYSLPFSAIDAVCAYFVGFVGDSRKMVVLWHQSLLVFVQRYKRDLTSAQKDSLRELLKVHSHPLITPEIRFELDSSPSRDAPAPAPAASASADGDLKMT